ncbi:MAG TPA: hypothetical protein VGE01_15085, partial [Fimbriimonas sp.]
ARYYFDQSRPRYDLVVQPGRDPSTLRLGYDGAKNLRIGADGLLRYDTSVGTVTEKGLYAYQKMGAGVRQVPAAFSLNGDGTVSYRLGAYDPTRPLVIDPTITYSSTVGNLGSGQVATSSIGTDGTALLAGTTTDPSFPVDSGAYDRSFDGSEGTQNGFVSRLGVDGVVEWTTFVGSDLSLNGVAVDELNRPIIVGTVNAATSLPASSNHKGKKDGVVLKLSEAGNELVLARNVGGPQNDGFNAVTVANGRIYIAGFGAMDFPTTPGAFDTRLRGNVPDGVVYVLDGATHEVVWSTFYGANGANRINGIAVDGQGNVNIGGQTLNGVFPVTSGAWDTSSNGPEGFVGQLNATGSTNNWCTFVGGSSDDVVNGLHMTTGDDVLVVGNTASGNVPGLSSAYVGSTDGFALRLTSSGGFVGGTYLGGPGDQTSVAVRTDGAGNPIVAGSATAAGSFISANALFANVSGGSDAYVVRLNPDATAPFYGTFLGIPGDDMGSSLNVAGSTAVIGGTDGTSLIATAIDFTPALQSLQLSTSEIVGTPGSLGQVTGTVVLDAPAFADTTVATSSNFDKATVGASATVLAGQTTGTFTVDTLPVTENAAGLVGASLGSASFSAPLTVKPVGVALSLSASEFVGNPGRRIPGQIDLSQVVNHPVTVSLTNTGAVASLRNSANQVIGSVTVAPGGSSTAFDVASVRAVMQPQDLTVTSTYGSATESVPLRILPPDIQSVTITPDVLKGTQRATVTVAFNNPVPADGQVLPRKMLYASGDLVDRSVPARYASWIGSANALAGVTTHTFTIVGHPSDRDTELYALVGGMKSNTLKIMRPRVQSVVLSPTSTTGPSVVRGAVNLDSIAPAGGLSVNLNINGGGIASLSADKVVVPEGTRRATFTVSALAVGADRQVVVTARVRSTDEAKTATLNLLAPRLKAITVYSDGVEQPNAGFAKPGRSVRVRISITSEARIGGMKVNLEEVGTLFLSLPVDPIRGYAVTIEGGTQRVVFPVAVSADAPVGTVIQAKAILNGQEKLFTITVVQ